MRFFAADKKLLTIFALCMSVICEAGTCSLDSGMCDPIPGSTNGNLYWTIDTIKTDDGFSLRLSFWREDYGMTERAGDATYVIPNYCGPDDYTCGTAPWYKYAGQIESIDLTCVDKIGDNAFRDMNRLGFVDLYAVQSLGDNVFLGCTSLAAIRTSYMGETGEITSITTSSLMLDATGRQVNIVIVPNDNSVGAFQYSDTWGVDGRVFVPATSYANSSEMHINTATDGSISLSVEYTPSSPEDPGDLHAIADIDTLDYRYPWHELRGMVKDLTIGDNIYYIGRDAFSSLTALQSIQFLHANHPIDSIHIDAFAGNITPWKFAFGHHLDGAAIPPKVVGMTVDTYDHFMHFKENTVLYVPDSTLWIDGEMLKVVDLYRQDPFWGTCFNRVNDRTVDTTDLTDHSVVLKWIPLENAQAYRLTISRLDCTEHCDTTIIIPAKGIQGLIDWENTDIPSSIAARRIPRGSDGGGLTLTITIKSGSGSSHTADAEFTVSGLEQGAQYSYIREVIKEDGEDESLTKSGIFSPQRISEDVHSLFVTDSIIRVYDLLGRDMGTTIHTLPMGVYIVNNGFCRTTICITR